MTRLINISVEYGPLLLYSALLGGRIGGGNSASMAKQLAMHQVFGQRRLSTRCSFRGCFPCRAKCNYDTDVNLSQSLLERGVTPDCDMTRCLPFWEKVLDTDPDKEYLLAGIKKGFHILEGHTPDFNACVENYKTASVNCKAQVESQLRAEVLVGKYVETPLKPRVVSALGAIPKANGSVRIIHDLSRPNRGLNQFVIDSSVTYSTVDYATKFMGPDFYLTKLDLKSAYRSVPTHSDCHPYMGIAWKFGSSKNDTYLLDTRLPFGSKKACQIFTRISNSIARVLHKQGI